MNEHSVYVYGSVFNVIHMATSQPRNNTYIYMNKVFSDLLKTQKNVKMIV